MAVDWRDAGLNHPKYDCSCDEKVQNPNSWLDLKPIDVRRNWHRAGHVHRVGLNELSPAFKRNEAWSMRFERKPAISTRPNRGGGFAENVGSPM
jgi:hypothetical protein